MPATPTHRLIGSHMRAHEKRWTAENRRNGISILNRWHAFCTAAGVDLLEADADICRAYMNARGDQVCGATAHKDWQHLRWFYRFLVTEEHIDTRRPHGPMEPVLPPTQSKPDPARIGYVSEGDYARLIGSFRRRSLIDCRDAAICSLMYWSGLRRSEVVRMDRDRVDLVGGTAEVLGKGNPPQWRTFPLMFETIEWLGRYLDRRDAAGDDAVALFASVGGRALEHATTGRLQPKAITMMLERRCKPLGLDLNAHEFRRAMAINSKRRGMSDSATMRVAGWKDPRMMYRYIQEEAEQLAVNEFQQADPTRIGRARRLRRVS